MVSAAVSAIVHTAVIAWLGLQQNPDASDHFLDVAVWLFPLLGLCYLLLYGLDQTVTCEEVSPVVPYFMLVTIGLVGLDIVVGNVDVSSLWAYFTFLFSPSAIVQWILPALLFGSFRGLEYLVFRPDTQDE